MPTNVFSLSKAERVKKQVRNRYNKDLNKLLILGRGKKILLENALKDHFDEILDGEKIIKDHPSFNWIRWEANCETALGCALMGCDTLSD